MTNKDDPKLINKTLELMAEKLKSRQPEFKGWSTSLVLMYYMMQAEELLKVKDETSNRS